jgi:hypothetical protein
VSRLAAFARLGRGSSVDAQDRVLGGFGEGGAGQKVLPVLFRLRFAHHQPVGAERFAVEEGGALQPGINLRLIALFGQRVGIDAQCPDQPVGDLGIRIGAVDLQRAAVHQHHMAADMEFVALGMAAEIVVVLQDQDARLGPGLAVEIGRGETGNAAAHHDQIELLVRVVQGGGAVPEIAVAQLVRRFEGAGMAAAHAQSGGRIIAGLVLGQRLGFGGNGQLGRKPGRERGDGGALEEIAPGDAVACTG